MRNGMETRHAIMHNFTYLAYKISFNIFINIVLKSFPILTAFRLRVAVVQGQAVACKRLAGRKAVGWGSAP